MLGNRGAEQRPVREKRERETLTTWILSWHLTARELSLSLALRLAWLATQYSLLSAPHSSSPGLGDCISMSPFPLLAPLDILPLTTPSFPPVCSNTVCCLPASLPIDPKGPSPKASHHTWLCVVSPSYYSGDIPSVDIIASVQDDAVHGCL